MRRKRRALNSYGPLMTSKELAEVLGVSQSTLSHWRQTETGPIQPVVNEGRVIRYSRTHVRRLTEARG